MCADKNLPRVCLDETNINYKIRERLKRSKAKAEVRVCDLSCTAFFSFGQILEIEKLFKFVSRGGRNSQMQRSRETH